MLSALEHDLKNQKDGVEFLCEKHQKSSEIRTYNKILKLTWFHYNQKTTAQRCHFCLCDGM